MQTIGVIGAGAWGTALAQILCKYGRSVTLYAREAELAASITDRHDNPTYLPGIPLCEDLKATSDIHEAAKAQILLITTPAQHVRTALEKMKDDITADTSIVICAKGVELQTGMLMSQVAKEVLPETKIAILTGPTFASEIARGLPSAVTLATTDKDSGKRLQEALGVKSFRPYLTEDVIGAQLGGAIKNVIAIACGIVQGRNMGDNARAALLTRGIAEIARLAVAMGAKKETLLGMCGIGDLMLTCSSMQSRNYSLGVALGEGKTLHEILGPRKAVTEGVHTAKATLELARKNAVDMPISEAVNKTLNEGVSIDEAIQEMLNRPFSYEIIG